MKKWVVSFVIILVLALLVVIAIFFLYRKDQYVHELPSHSKRSGVAVIMTGAAARIPQEAALLEELDRQGLLKNLVFIAGVSSGALNAVMLNGIVDKKITWKDYRKILYGLKNEDIFVFDNVRFPFDVSPSRKLYSNIIEKRLGYHAMGDLPVTTEISISNIKRIPPKTTVYRLCSRKINEESDTTLSIVDILMASTAFPVVFPPAKIPNAKTIPDLDYVDGGVGDDQIPFRALLQFEKYRGVGVEKVYIISRDGDDETKISDELKALGIDDDGVFDKVNISVDTYLRRGIIKKLQTYAKEAPDLVPRTYVWIPDFGEEFPMFNFGNMKQQYETTTQWARSNPPKPLAEYLLPYLLEK
jgi:predicted acylesterase/phospholipase RssA